MKNTKTKQHFLTTVYSILIVHTIFALLCYVSFINDDTF